MSVFYAMAFHKVGMDPLFEHVSSQKVSDICFLFGTRLFSLITQGPCFYVM